MIAINCTHCQQRLEMDEAFAGGVCRCQHCGTIQTVPSHLKKAAASTPSGNGAKAAGGHAGSGLDELADVVASSGLARSGLSKKPRTAHRTAPVAPAVAASAASAATIDYAEAQPGKSPLVPVLLGAGVVVLALIGVILYLVLSNGAPQTAGGSKGDGGANVNPIQEPTLTIPGPAYADVSLADARSVVYLLDRSRVNADVLDKLKASVYYSAESLGPERRFQVLLWSPTTEDGAPEIVGYPAGSELAAATKDRIKEAAAAFDDVIGHGSTELGPALKRAVKADPDVIVIATAKGLSLGDETLEVADKALGGTVIKVHTFALGDTESPVLKQIAERTGGEYRELSNNQLSKLLYRLPLRE